MSVAFWFMIAVVATAGLSFAAVVVWLAARARERGDQLRNDTIRKIMESGGSAPALEYMREVERAERARIRNRVRLTGLVTIAVGAGLMAFLAAWVFGAPVYLAGLIPVLVGVALLIFSEFFMRPTNS
jgi:hypothetical protein